MHQPAKAARAGNAKSLSESTCRDHLKWSDGTRATIDVGAVLHEKGFRAAPRRGIREHSCRGMGTFDPVDQRRGLGADTLWLETLSAKGHDDARSFVEWRLRHGLSPSETADALGLSRRMVGYYSNGEKPVPKPVLACKG